MSFISRIFSPRKKPVAQQTPASLDDPYKSFEKKISLEIYNLEDPAKAREILIEIEAKKAESYDAGFKSTLGGLETYLKNKADSLVMQKLSEFFIVWNEKLEKGSEPSPDKCKHIAEYLHASIANLDGLCHSEFKTILISVDYLKNQNLSQPELISLISTAENLNNLIHPGNLSLSMARIIISNPQYWEHVKYITSHKISAETSVPILRKKLIQIQQEVIKIDTSAKQADPNLDNNKDLRRGLLSDISMCIRNMDFLLSLLEKKPHFERIAQQILPIENVFPILEKKIGDILVMHGTSFKYANKHVSNGLPAKIPDGQPETYFSVDGSPHGSGPGKCYLVTKIKHIMQACTETGESFAYYNDDYYLGYFGGKAIFIALKEGNTKGWENKLISYGYSVCIISETHKLQLPYVVLFKDVENANEPDVGPILSKLPRIYGWSAESIKIASSLL